MVGWCQVANGFHKFIINVHYTVYDQKCRTKIQLPILLLQSKQLSKWDLFRAFVYGCSFGNPWRKLGSGSTMLLQSSSDGQVTSW